MDMRLFIKILLILMLMVITAFVCLFSRIL